ncbi:Cysteine-rich receptor-like protein kinase 25 [Platanthera zijinensis]|uniref:Cysteine-rich receptor-like protein kinase 25 n=1 Tax=Platanthera zijinensis TaxID=2320716 RepID=A0AAP0BLM5_9ASPA
MPPPTLLSRHLAAFLILLLLHIAVDGVYSQDHAPFLTYCDGDNYTTSSPYESNLRRLIPDLVSSTPASPSYFSLINSTTSPKIYGLAQCRPDVSSVACAACLNNSASIAPKPNGGCLQKTSGFLRDDNCLLIYSDQDFYTAVHQQIFVFLTGLPNASSDSFSRDVQTLMNGVIASASVTALRFAVANASADAADVFAMGWCSMDLTTDSCFQCLHRVLEAMPAGKNRGICSTVSCAVRFETYQFYSDSMIQPEPAGSSNKTLAVAPVVSAGNNNNKTSAVAPVASAENNNNNRTVAVPPAPGNNNNKTTAVIVGASVAVASLLLFTLFVILLQRMKRRLIASNIRLPMNPMDEELSNAEIRMIDFSTLEKATNNFAIQNKLGQGGFGPVYKGVLMNGQEVAVKRLSAISTQGIQEMKNEIQFVANLRHRNLVRLLGYCLQGEEKLLVYEFLPNTSLDKFLLNPIRKTWLDWETRLKIIVGVGRGLLYLHEDSQLRIVHRDLKASNILLDIDMNPKISDFGLAKLFKVNETERNTSRIAGTPGYMAPEYVLHGLFSTKSDVFSYGVLVLEIITGMKPSVDESEEAVDLQSFVWRHWREGRALEVVDRSLEDRYSAQEALRCVQIGLLCVQEDQVKRPKMGSVVMMLSSSSMTLEIPSMPAIYKERSISAESESPSRSEDADLLERGTVNHRHVLPGVGR